MLEGLDSDVELVRPVPQPQNIVKKRLKTSRKRTAKEMMTSSFVKCNTMRKGNRVIKIEVYDLNECQDTTSESAVVSCQWVCEDPMDEILDLTENLIKKITKKMCDNNF
ncbi:hypothetical protein JYU34_006886 [Plutella xylostella]|nr:hypothetical protein JYU34_022633 [Plutella xylostella]KAG7298682.1 hypothetical protein JYU34_017088 [Plutella xylostella]KAG7308216.1 hypothetical protein JYU34_006886 [Plutella xylostella]